MNGDPTSEDGAGNLIRKVLGAERYSRTGGDSASSDGYLTFQHGSEIQLEVTRSMIPEFAQAAAEAEKAGHEILLDNGSGEWTALLSPETRIKDFRQLPSDAIRRFAKGRSLSLSNPNLLMNVNLESFNVVALSGRPSERSALRFEIIAMNPNARISISTHPNVIADFALRQIALISELAAQTGRRSKFTNLVARSNQSGRIAHFAIVVLNTLDTGLQFALWEATRIHRVDKPDQDIQLPEGIASIWIIRPDFQLAFSFSSEVGWARHSLAELKDGSQNH